MTLSATGDYTSRPVQLLASVKNSANVISQVEFYECGPSGAPPCQVLGRNYGPVYLLEAPATTPGVHWFMARAVDEFGNRKDSSAVSITRKVDLNPPVAQPFHLEGQISGQTPLAGHPFTIVVPVSDAESGLDQALLRRNGEVIASIFQNGTLRYDEAAPTQGQVFQYTLSARDKAGLSISPEPTQTFVASFDSLPVIDSVVIAATVREQSSFPVTVNAHDDLGVKRIEVEWRGQVVAKDIATPTPTASQVLTVIDARPRIIAAEPDTLTIRAVDTVGQVVSTTRSVSVVPDNTPNAALVAVGAPPNAYFAGQVRVTLSNLQLADDGPSSALKVSVIDVSTPTAREAFNGTGSNTMSLSFLAPADDGTVSNFRFFVRLTDALGQTNDGPITEVLLTRQPNLVSFDSGGDSGLNLTSVTAGQPQTLRVVVRDAASGGVPFQRVGWRIVSGPNVANLALSQTTTDSTGASTLAFDTSRAAGLYSVEAYLVDFPLIRSSIAFEVRTGTAFHLDFAYVKPARAGEVVTFDMSAFDKAGNFVVNSNEQLVTITVQNPSFHFGFADNVVIEPIIGSSCNCVTGELARIQLVNGRATISAFPGASVGTLSAQLATSAGVTARYDQDNNAATTPTVATFIPILVKPAAPAKTRLALVSITEPPPRARRDARGGRNGHGTPRHRRQFRQCRERSRSRQRHVRRLELRCDRCPFGQREQWRAERVHQEPFARHRPIHRHR